MSRCAYRFELNDTLALDDAELTVGLALMAAEGLFGAAAVRMDAAYHRAETERAIVVDASTEIGSAVVRLMTQFLTRQFGASAFRVSRLIGSQAIGSNDRVAAA